MKIYLIFFALTLLSCADKIQPENQSITNPMESQKDGFTEMTILETKNSCQYFLQDDQKNLYEVENISNKIPKIQTGIKVWIKFTRLRKMSVCEAQPISIDEIYKEK